MRRIGHFCTAVGARFSHGCSPPRTRHCLEEKPQAFGNWGPSANLRASRRGSKFAFLSLSEALLQGYRLHGDDRNGRYSRQHAPGSIHAVGAGGDRQEGSGSVSGRPQPGPSRRVWHARVDPCDAFTPGSERWHAACSAPELIGDFQPSTLDDRRQEAFAWPDVDARHFLT
jgi:hypothetical protein